MVCEKLVCDFIACDVARDISSVQFRINYRMLLLFNFDLNVVCLLTFNKLQRATGGDGDKRKEY